MCHYNAETCLPTVGNICMRTLSPSFCLSLLMSNNTAPETCGQLLLLPVFCHILGFSGNMFPDVTASK